MIFDSRFWKRDLQRTVGELRRRKAQRRWTNASIGSFEKSIMVGFYALRRLFEAFQPMLSIARKSTLSLTLFPSRGKRHFELGWPEVDELCDLTKQKIVERELCLICNQIIHSYLFTPWFGQNGQLEGIFFSSDKKKGSEVYRMDLDAIIDLFEEVATRKGKWLMRFGPEKNMFVMRRHSHDHETALTRQPGNTGKTIETAL